MSKQNQVVIEDNFFDGLTVETSNGTKLIQAGEHIVNNVIGDDAKKALIVLSNGTADGSFDDRVRQVQLRVKSQSDGAEMNVYLTLDAHKRYAELSEADIAGVRGSHLAISEDAFKALKTFEDKRDAIFSSYQNESGEEIALSNIDAPAHKVGGKVVRPALQQNCRIIDPVRSKNIRKKLMSLVAVTGIAEVGAPAPTMPEILEALNTNEYEFGIKVSGGISNQKGQSMPRVDYFMNADQVKA